MKEYLNKNTYEYKLAHTKPDGDWLVIPAGAESYNQYSEGQVNNTFFLRMIGDNYYFANEDNDYSWEWYASNLTGHEFALWVRPTQPEALPFIDDNPQSLNEQYAEIEKVRQAGICGTVKAKPDFNFGAAEAIKVKSGSDSDHMADAMSYGFMGGIDATLAQRQSTYGSFEDVAFVTENIMSILGSVRVNGLSELPNTHRMALYMIASKMARIVNGDFNHIDSWHDIGGYAKLIEDLVKENDNG